MNRTPALRKLAGNNMCGIAGIVSDNSPIDPSQLESMKEALQHRGPDDEGSFFELGVALGSQRLSILDQSPSAKMPMTSTCGRYVIVYNGEVYNFKEIRKQLESKGHRFLTKGDTEVVLNSFIEFGRDCLSRFNGMFSLAIWDKKERSLFAARDRLGIKPFYYSNNNNRFLFGSEQKALIAAGHKFELNTEQLGEIFCFRFVAGTQTAYKNIYKLLPGHCLEYKKGHLKTQAWWQLTPQNLKIKTNEIHEYYEDLFADAVKLRCISDRPVGILLSGGLDSGAVAAALDKNTYSERKSFTVGFDEEAYDESALAQLTASKFKFEFNRQSLSSDKLLDLLPYTSWLNDEPLVHGNDPHIHHISRFAKDKVTVLLSGEGGDELHGGYVRYRPLQHPKLFSLLRNFRLGYGLRHFSSARIKKLANFSLEGGLDFYSLYNSCNILPSKLRELGFIPKVHDDYRRGLQKKAKELYPDKVLRQSMYIDQFSFLSSVLHRNDRMTMGASIECRVPFLDHRIVEMMASLPNTVQRSFVDQLPEEVQTAPKWGFGVPWLHYLRKNKKFSEVLKRISQSELVAEHFRRPQKIQSELHDFFAGSTENELFYLQLFFTGVWKESLESKVEHPLTRSQQL